jgi:hypothetical protein
MIHARGSSPIGRNAASIVIPLAPLFEGSATRDPLFPGPSIFRAKQNRQHRNFIGGK